MGVAISCDLYGCVVVSEEVSVPLHIRLRYQSADPYAVHAAFYTDDGEMAEWIFARELLAQGLHRPAGRGDVRVWPIRRHAQTSVRIALTSMAGTALIEAPAHGVQSFLKRTEVAVPPGSERVHLDLDAQLTHLLAES